MPSALLLLLSSTLWHTSTLILRDETHSQDASASYTDDDTFQGTVLNVTNTYRKQHNATALRWNESLAERAEEWSSRCEFEHSGGPTGENLASGYANASASVIAWGHERVDHAFEEGEFTYAKKRATSRNSYGKPRAPLDVGGRNVMAKMRVSLQGGS